MGRAKEEQMRLDDLEAQAMGILVTAGAVKECKIHDGIFIDQEDPDLVKRAYAIGTNAVKEGRVGGTREEFMDAIQSAYGNAGYECPICTKYRDED